MMLHHTFCHLPGVGDKTEQRWWAQGITCWEQAHAAVKPGLVEYLHASRHSLGQRDAGYFAARLAPRHQWRLYRDFQDSCAFVDIETTGLDDFSAITTIVLFDGTTVRHYVQGVNLEQFTSDIRDYQLLVTFNGKCFDAPFLRRCLGAVLPEAHIDLRHTLKSLGLRGGLKACERSLGISRGDAEGVDGFLAVLLWHEYRRTSDPRALETLLAYNVRDTVNLQTLMIHAHNANVRAMPFGTALALAPRTVPECSFRVDTQLVERLSRQMAQRFGGYAWSR